MRQRHHRFTTHSPTGLAWIAAAALMSGCASAPLTGGTPVLYPNAAYKSMGETAARQQLDQCMALARQSGAQASDGAAAQGAVRGAAVAGVTGAVGSLVFGRGQLDDALRTGAKSAVVGAAAGGVGGAMSERASGTYRQFVQRCAAEKGLEVIGWN